MTELSQASSSAQVGLVASPVTLSYAAEDHQFQLEVTNVSKIAYLLEYSSVNKDDKKIRQAVNKSGAANDQGVYSETILAGTQSGDDQFFHDVTEGKLEVIDVSRMRRGEKTREEIVAAWNPKTQLGREVKDGKVKNIDEILDKKRKVLEYSPCRKGRLKILLKL